MNLLTKVPPIEDLQLGEIKQAQRSIDEASNTLLQIMMNRRQRRIQIIQYFLRVAQAQEEVQTLQNQLATHLRFNPAILFKRVGANGHTLTIVQLSHYIQKWAEINDREVIRVYMEKHNFHSSIHLSEFSASLLPYTPNVLREATEKIDKQMETKHLDRVIQELYQKILDTQLKNIYEISLYQRNLALDWTTVKSFILKDLKEKSRHIDLPEEECSMVGIRRWLQMWISIEQYKILNMMRWFGGSEEAYIERYYHSSRIQPKCTCNSSHSSRQQQSSLSKQLPSCSKERQKFKKVKSTAYLLNSNQLLKHFLRYVDTIIKSQRRLQLLREGLRPHKREVELILHEITSKKSNFTRLGKIIQQVQKVLRIKDDMINKLLRQLQHSKVDNNFLFSLFAAPSKKCLKSHKMTHEQMMIEIYEVLYTFCLCKATLKSTAREICGGADLIFSELDEHNKKYLDKTDLKLILNESGIKCKQEDLSILMNHFGDGDCIRPQSFREVFQIQSGS